MNFQKGGRTIFFFLNDIIYTKGVEEWAKPHNELAINVVQIHHLQKSNLKPLTYK